MYKLSNVVLQTILRVGKKSKERNKAGKVHFRSEKKGLNVS